MSEGEANSPINDHTQPSEKELSTIADRIRTTENSVQVALEKDDIQTNIALGMQEYPEVAQFVEEKIKKALTPEEAKLITETALVTYYVTQSLRPHTKSTDTNRPNLQSMIAVSEDEIALQRENNNSIYERILHDTKENPEMAEYMVKQMQKSINLEEGNLVGETALVIYDSLKDYLKQ